MLLVDLFESYTCMINITMRNYIEIFESMKYGLLTENRGRMDFLLNTYGAKLEAKWQAGLAGEPGDVKTAVQSIPGEAIPAKLIGYISSFDPSQNGQYTQWLMLQYLKNTLRLENFPETKDLLELFSIMKAKKQLPAGHSDINHFHGFDDLVNGLKQYSSAQLPTKLERKWKATSATEPQNIQAGVSNQKGRTVGDKVLAYIQSFDPSNGKHTYWLGTIWLTNGLRLEDLEAAHDDLQAFDKMTSTGQLTTNLDKIPTLSHLAALVRKVPDQTNVGEISDVEETKMLAQSKVLYDGDDLRIIVPLTQAAACYFGRNTDWCTAWGNHLDLGLSKNGRFPNRTNRFNDYKSQGQLYIIEIYSVDVGRKRPKLYQYHQETDQFCNARDTPLSKNKVKTLLSEHPEIKETIGDALYDIGELYSKFGMTKGLLEKINNSLYRGLDIGSYDASKKRFIVQTWTNFEQFIKESCETDYNNVDKILSIAKHGIDREDIDEEDIDEATNSYIKKVAMNRLKDYSKVGWYFVGHGVYSNIPYEINDFEKFAISNETVELYVDENDMVEYAMVDADDDDDDDDYTYSVLRMNDGNSTASWDMKDTEYMDQQRRDFGLIDRNGDDTWLKNDLNVYLNHIGVDSPYPRIDDKNQQEFKFENMNRLLKLAGIIL